MEVVIVQKGEETVIKIKGRLDTNTARECEEKVLPVWENPGVKVCVDCSDLEYVSSSGLRLLCGPAFVFNITKIDDCQDRVFTFDRYAECGS